MNSAIISALIGGAFALLCAAVGAWLSYLLRNRALKEQRAYDEELRHRERVVAERERAFPVSDSDAKAVGEMLDRGGKLLFGCFPRETMVAMGDGSFRPIEKLRQGDLIKVFRASSHVSSSATVKQVVTGAGKRLVLINKTVAVTPEQAVWCDGRYQTAGSLKLGGMLVSDLHHEVRIASLESTDIDEDVYCVTLNEDAGYFIKGQQGGVTILVREATRGKTAV